MDARGDESRGPGPAGAEGVGPFLRAVLETAFDALLVVEADATILWVAPNPVPWTQRPPEVGESLLDFVFADDRGSLSSAVHAAAAHPGEVSELLLRAGDSDRGRWMAVRITSPGEDGTPGPHFVVSMRDVEELVAARDRASEANEELLRTRLAIASAAFGVASISPDGHFLRVNPALSAILEYPEGELVGTAVADLTHPADLPAFEQSFERLRSGRADRINERKRCLTKSGQYVWVEVTLSAVRDGNGRLDYVLSQVVDVTSEVASREALARSSERYRLLAENASDVVYSTDTGGRIQWVSPSVRDRLGWLPESLVGTRAVDLVDPEDVERVNRLRAQVYQGREVHAVLCGFRRVDGGIEKMSATAKPIVDADDRIVGAVVGLRDMAFEDRLRSRVEDLLRGISQLHSLPLSATEHDLLTAALDLAVALTNSTVGYMHYVNDDQETLELGLWSSGIGDFCTVAHDRHYPLSTAGIWADTFRSRTPHVHNDYVAEPGRRGLPDGHAPVVRHLGVPVIDGERVRLLMGVGNKTAPYDSTDVEIAQMVADEAWLLLQRTRAHRDIATRLELMTSRRAGTTVGIWEWDPGTGLVTLDAVSAALVLGPSGHPGNYQPTDVLAKAMSPADRAEMTRLSRSLAKGDVLEFTMRDPNPINGKLLRVLGEWHPRRHGVDEVVRGTVGDVSLEHEAATAKERAVRDPLTGLLNREGLADDLRTRLAGVHAHLTPDFAVLFVDLDGFKRVNDDFGHVVGDGVLRECAHRLASTIRAGDIAARVGGDEFVVVQSHGVTETGMLALARRIISEVSKPMTVEGHTFTLGASIGASTSDHALPDGNAMIDIADKAMYRAKRNGTGVEIAR